MSQKLSDRLSKLKHLSFYKDWLGHYIGGLYHRADHHHVFLLSGGMAFSILVCVIPLVLIIFSALGYILERTSLTEEITTFIDQAIPYEQYADYVKDLVISRVTEFKAYRSIAQILGVAGLLFAASGLFSSMRTILNKIYRAKTEESVLWGKLKDLFLILLVLVYFLLSTTILPGISIIRDIAHEAPFLERFSFGYFEDILLGTVSFLIIFVAFLVVYYAVPYERPNRRVYIVSAIWAAILWEIAKELFGYYITAFATLKRVYGAYALTIITGFWIYYTSLVFILGAEIGQLYRERRRKRLGLDPEQHWLVPGEILRPESEEPDTEESADNEVDVDENDSEVARSTGDEKADQA